MDIIFLICILIVISIPIAIIAKESIFQYGLRKRIATGTTTEEDDSKYNQIIKKEQKRISKEKEKAKHTTIKKVIIVNGSSDSRKKMGSSIMRGAVGGALLGPAGLVGGAVSGKNKVTNYTTFLVEYEDGHRETLTVITGSGEFNKLCKYLEM